MLPQIRFLRAAIGPRGNIVGLPVRKDGPRVMSSATASSVLQALRGPVKRGTARERKLVARSRLRQDRHLVPQRGCPVRRPHPGLRRQHLAWARPSGADAWRSWRRHAGKILLEADGLLLRQARASALRGKRGDGGRRFALGQTEDFRRKAAWDHRHDRAWLAGGVVLRATGLVPPERAPAESRAHRAAA